MVNEHKGRRGDAEMYAFMVELDPDWNPNTVIPELFHELNFNASELQKFCARVTDRTGAVTLAEHPNSNMMIKAILSSHLQGD